MSEKIVCTNKKAYHNYQIEDTVEAGIALKGTEVKALREGRANITDSYAKIVGREIFLVNAHISHYSCGNIYNHDPLRTRKLLLHKKEIDRLIGKINERGYTLIPLKIYFNKRGFAKVELALAKGKKLYDRREEIKKKDQERELRKELKRFINV